MNYPQIMSPVPFASKSGGHVPSAPMGAPPMYHRTCKGYLINVPQLNY